MELKENLKIKAESIQNEIDLLEKARLLLIDNTKENTLYDLQSIVSAINKQRLFLINIKYSFEDLEK